MERPECLSHVDQDHSGRVERQGTLLERTVECGPIHQLASGARVSLLDTPEVVQGSDFADSIVGSPGDDYIDGGDGADRILAGAGNDSLDGGGGSDEVVGEDGQDVLSGGEADTASDTVLGGQGDDSLAPTSGDYVDGGVGLDSVDFTEATGSVEVDLTNGHFVMPDGPGEITSMELVQGSEFDDRVVTGADTVGVFSGPGNDALEIAATSMVVDGGEGEDALDLAPLAAGVVIDTSTGQFSPANSDQAGSDSLVGSVGGVEVLAGGPGPDTFISSAASSESISGAGGNDTFNVQLDDIVDGGAGTNVLDFSTSPQGVRVNLSTGTIDGVPASTNLANVTTVIGSPFDDTIIGSGLNETIRGGDGNDIINGNLGDDVLDGGAGTDTVSYALGGTGAVVDISLTTPQNTRNGGTDTLTGFENLTGSNQADTLYGTSGVNRIVANNANDIVWGRGGNDDLFGSEGNDKLYGEAGNDLLNGGPETDTCDGGSGTDTHLAGCETRTSIP
jgi:Ca2+-binding RTX toxin-like protein